MTKYVEIVFDKQKQTQRFVIVDANDCTASMERKLQARHIPFTGHKFCGRRYVGENYKEQTYKYAQKWLWLNTVDVSEDE